VGKPEGKNHLVDLGVDGRMGNIKMDCNEIGWKCLGYINMSLYWDKLRAVVKAVMNLRIL
jgi:hypothetical protein